MGNLAIYESWKDNRKFTKEKIKQIYDIEGDFDYYCDYIKTRISTDDRKELDRLKNDIRNNKISTVLFQSPNHISRDINAFISFIEFASNNNCNVTDIGGFNYNNFYKFNKKIIEQTVEEHFEIKMEKIRAILEVSEDYGINFDSTNPFDYFDADNGNYNMSSFTEYYNDIFKKLNISFDSMFTKEVSAGKYKLILDDEIIELSAWDSLDSVIDNIDSALEIYRNKNKEMEV